MPRSTPPDYLEKPCPVCGAYTVPWTGPDCNRCQLWARREMHMALHAINMNRLDRLFPLRRHVSRETSVLD